MNIILVKSDNPANNINSHVNFKVNGSAKKHKHIRIIDIPKFGHICISPDKLVKSRVPSRFCIKSTKKNIKADNIACIKQNKIPEYTSGVCPNMKQISNKFISWTVHKATTFFRSTCDHICKEDTITPVSDIAKNMEFEGSQWVDTKNL